MKKYEGHPNVVGNLIEKCRKAKKYNKSDLCRKLQLHGVYIDRVELYKMEKGQMIIKDFELIALCKVLDINYEELKNTIE